MGQAESVEPMYISSVGDIIIIILISLCGLLINWKFLKNMNEDDKDRPPDSNGNIIKDVMTTHTKTLMVIVPPILLLFWLLNEDLEQPMWLQYLFCYERVIVMCFRLYFGFTSLVVATMRYTFIVHQNNATLFGIEKAKTIFYYGSIVIPLMIGIMHECTIGEVPEVFRDTPRSICIDSYRNSHNITDFNFNVTQSIGSPIYSFVHRYISTEITYYVSHFVHILQAIIFLNAVEGILYWKTFSYIKRTQGRGFLNQLLTDDERGMRRRRQTVNIQITFLSWVLEFIAGNLIITVAIWGNKRFHQLYKLLDICLGFVVIPCTFILNRDVTKRIIVLGNWYQGLRSIFVANGQVAPINGIEAAPPDPPAPAENAAAPHEHPAPVGDEDQRPDIPVQISSPSRPGNANVSSANQRPTTETIPLSNVRVIRVASTSK